MRDYDRSADTLKIWEMSLAGASSREIETELGFKFAKINSALRRGRESQVLPPPPKKPISHVRHHKNYMRLGSVSAILDALNDEQVDWLAAEARKIKCETLAEYIVEIIRDAHAIEVTK